MNKNQISVKGLIPQWLFWILGGLAGILFLLTSLGWYFQQNIQAFLAKQAIQYIDADIRWKKLNISLIRDWPNVRIQLSDVSLKPKKETQHFLKAKHIQAVLDFWDFWAGKYIIKKIRIDEPDIFIEQKNGIWNVNQIQLKKSNTTQEPSPFHLALKEISLNHGHLRIHSHTFSTEIQEIQALLGGDFSAKNSIIATQLQSQIVYFQKEKRRYIEDKSFGCNGPLVINHAGSISGESLQLNLASLLLNISGYWNWKKEETRLQFKASDGSLEQLLSLFPEKWTSHIAHLEAKGAFSLAGKLSYGLSGTPDELKIIGDLNQAEMVEPETKAKLNDLSTHLDLHWWFDNPEKSYLYLENIKTEIKNERIRGQMRWKNFQSGEWDWIIQGKADLQELVSLFPNLLVQTDSIAGQLWLNVQTSGKWEDWEQKEYKKVYQLGQIRLSQVNIKPKKWEKSVEMEAEIEFDGQKIIIQRLEGNMGHSDFLIKGSLSDYWDFLSDSSKKMAISGSFESKNIDTHDFITQGSDTQPSEMNLPQNIDLELIANIQHFRIAQLEAKDLKSTIIWKNQELQVQPLHCNSMGGNIQINGILKPKQGNPLFSCEYDLQNIDIQEFNKSFPELMQHSSYKDKLWGKCSLLGEMKGMFTPEWHWLTDSMFVKGNFIFKDGKLKQFQPTKRLAKILKLQEFEDLDFSDLSTQVLVDQQRLHLSKFYLRANTLEMTLSGSQGWDETLDYRVQIFFPRKLSKLRDDEKDEWIDTVEPSGRASVFLKVTGTIEQPNIQLDMKNTRKQLMENLFKNKHRSDSLKKDKKQKRKK